MRLIEAKESDLKQIYAQMQKAFPFDEVREFDDFVSVFSNEDHHVFYLYEGKSVGFVELWQLDDMIFVEHIAVFEEERNKGFGSAAFELLERRYKRIVLEIEPPETETQKRRLDFYLRCGFVVNDFDYVQPPYGEGKKALHLVLMSYPVELHDCEKIQRELHEKVYVRQVKKADF